MNTKEIVRCEIDGNLYGEDDVLYFDKVPTVQDILQVLTDKVEAEWDGRMLPFGIKSCACPVSMSLRMKKVRAGYFRLFRQQLNLN